MDTYVAFGIVAIVFLLICSGLVSGAEMSFFSMSKKDLDELKKASPKHSKRIIKLLSKPETLLATLLIVNNLINIAIVIIYDGVSFIVTGGLPGPKLWSVDLKLVLEIGVVTLVVLVFGEVLPKIYASQNKILFSKLMSYPVMSMVAILKPFTTPMRWVSDFLDGVLVKEKPELSVKSLSQVLDLTLQGDTTHQEQKMLRGIITFGATETRQIMTPRVDIFALSEEMDFDTVMEHIIKHSFSRMPVYKNSLDHITGVLYAKDLLAYIDKPEANWARLKKDVIFVSENKKLDDLFKEFQDSKNHLAIVVDEYGGTSGLITMDDVIKEIVGDISDEFDTDDLDYTMIDQNTYLFEGKTMLMDFYKIIKPKDPNVFENKKGESETIGGFISEILGRIPQNKEKINFEGYIFTIENANNKRIKQVKLNLPK